MQEAFFALADRLRSGIAGQEVLFCSLGGEVSEFVRLNRNRIRQAGQVRTARLGLNLIHGARQVEGSCNLSGEPRADLEQARWLLGRLRERLAHVPEDPFLNYSTDPSEGQRQMGDPCPPAEEAVAELIAAARGMDLVGIWASGEMFEGLASSIGHRHWHRSLSFNLDWSCFLEADKGVKAGCAGLHWDATRVHRRLRVMREELRVMAGSARTIAPGRYRAYLAPAAVQELMDLLADGGFDLRSHRTCQTPLLGLARGERELDAGVSIREEHGRGLTADFTAQGFLKPASVVLVEKGRYGRSLVDARDGKEYGEAVNAATDAPESLGLDPGDIPLAEVLRRLDRGLYIGNLWYGNWSDSNACRLTGMTRFGTYWVENGEIVSPVNVMRFDDSLYHLLGDRLEGLTRERELILSADTYEGRSTESSLLPGLLVSGIELAL